DQATAAIDRRCGKILGKRQAEDLVIAAAGDIDAFYRQQMAMPATADTLVVLQVDGKGIVMRPEALRPATLKAHQAARRAIRTRLAPGQKPHRKRMATLACVFDAIPASRRPHDIIAPSDGRSRERTPRPGPRAAAKWLTGPVVHPPELTAQAIRSRLRGAKRQAADSCVGSLTGHLDQLGYDTALAAGWPIATGAIEGACRHLIGDRLDITGARWGLPGAEAILKLRALTDNGDFPQYWAFHLAREHERLYPTPNQHRYQLTA